MAPSPRPPAKCKERARPSEAQQERQRLAQLLHNTVCQELTGICFLAGAAAYQHGTANPEVRQKFEEIADLVQRAGASLAEIVHALRKAS